LDALAYSPLHPEALLLSALLLLAAAMTSFASGLVIQEEPEKSSVTPRLPRLEFYHFSLVASPDI